MVHWPALQSLCGQHSSIRNVAMSLGKSKSDSQKSKDKVQAEHDCLRPVVSQVKEIYENGGIKTKVMGRHVNVVILI